MYRRAARIHESDCKVRKYRLAADSGTDPGPEPTMVGQSIATPVTKILTCLWLEREDAPVIIVLYCLIKCTSIIRDR